MIQLEELNKIISIKELYNDEYSIPFSDLIVENEQLNYKFDLKNGKLNSIVSIETAHEHISGEFISKVRELANLNNNHNNKLLLSVNIVENYSEFEIRKILTKIKMGSNIITEFTKLTPTFILINPYLINKLSNIKENSILNLYKPFTTGHNYIIDSRVNKFEILIYTKTDVEEQGISLLYLGAGRKQKIDSILNDYDGIKYDIIVKGIAAHNQFISININEISSNL